ncbi:hypothetical protein J1614_007732 [Plenodomus biglobosus]|nr:hypothetical protein J1614_007732 [Plenodomus biglobosus]
MNSRSTVTLNPAEAIADRVESNTSTSAMSWKAQHAIWKNVLDTKYKRACELATVHSNLFKAAKYTVTMGKSTKVSDLTSDLLKSQIFIKAHFAAIQREEEHAQRMSALKGTNPSMKVCDPLEKILTKLINIKSPATKVRIDSTTMETWTNLMKPAQSVSTIPERKTTSAEAKENTAQEPKHFRSKINVGRRPIVEETGAMETLKDQTEPTLPDAMHNQISQGKKR